MENVFKVAGSKESAKTTRKELEKVEVLDNGVLIIVKTWPAQTEGGIIGLDKYQVIRAEKLVCEVVGVGPDVTMVKVGDIVVASMYSGHHIVTNTGHAKVLLESDILIFKENSKMLLDPSSYFPGIDYITVKIYSPKDIVSENGIIVPAHQLSAENSKQDVATRTAEVIRVGPAGTAKKNRYDKITEGTTVVFDSYVGLDLPVSDITDKFTYKIMYIWDVLAIINK
ncbi:MAG: hypothetical protein KAH32_06345 [Chlamydiia bacterium]|nr:hypothetical protein [Chlamydiia bacterium]